jgi:CCR4-NOT transcription complex subunit 2
MQQRLASSTSNLMSSSSLAGAGSTTPAGVSLGGDYGLLGLLGIIRMSDADRNALALGSDLTTLGLNLNSNDQLYSNFASPWSESLTTREPQYQVRNDNGL